MHVTPTKFITPQCTGECVCTCNVTCDTQCSNDCISHCKCECTCAHMLPVYAAHKQNIQVYNTSEASETSETGETGETGNNSETSSCVDSCANAKRNQLAHNTIKKNVDYNAHVRMLKRIIADEQYKTTQIEYYNTQLCEIINKRTEATKHTQQLLEILTKSLSTALLSLPQPTLDTDCDK